MSAAVSRDPDGGYSFTCQDCDTHVVMFVEPADFAGRCHLCHFVSTLPDADRERVRGELRAAGVIGPAR